MRNRISVAIPVKNEEDRIGTCLHALLAQTVAADDIVLLLNNCTDGTRAICRGYRARHPHIQIIDCELPPNLASAGEARRLALEYAAQLAGDGVLLTSDADSVVPRDWIEINLLELSKGAGAVCGMAAIDAAEAQLIPQDLHDDDARETACFELLDQIEALVDPDPFDPWPRHKEHSGASIAVTVPAFRKAGGAPNIAAGEDRALIRNLTLVDTRIRHTPELVVRVSGRLEGRAAGGMAETIRRRMTARDEWTDDRLEPATDAYRRALAKAASRAAWQGEQPAAPLAQDLLVSRQVMADALAAPYFGAAWELIQNVSPVLKRRRIAVADLPRATRQAVLLRDQLLAEAGHHEVATQAVTFYE